jgi:ketosteroid isomerase-like protein
MTETEQFLAEILPRLTAADTALHNGDAGLRKVLWSAADPVTLFGAAIMANGWPEIEATFDRLATNFTDCASFVIDVVAAGASGDVAYLVAFERTTVSIAGDAPAPYVLRVTTVFRRERGEWKIVHRHADPVPEDRAARERLTALRADWRDDGEGTTEPR